MRQLSDLELHREHTRLVEEEKKLLDNYPLDQKAENLRSEHSEEDLGIAAMFANDADSARFRDGHNEPNADVHNEPNNTR